MYKKVLLKLSGEALGDETSCYNFEKLNDYAKQIKTLVKKGVQVGIVCGGGNICRGRTFQQLGMDRKHSDYVGMCATNLNAQVLSEALTNNKVNNIVFTKYPCANIKDYDITKAKAYLKKGYVCIFGGGTGKPFFSTDTACAQRASELGLELILFAKNGVDGVYDKDPNKYADAKRIAELSYNDIIKNKLEVIDLDAAKILKKNNIHGYVFNMQTKNAIASSINQKVTGTVIK